ncbi:MAG: winged helix-turn-helix domain-containing protein [Nitrososphaerota archaeon]|nr:winged helix-turn-helix domain-containing protein [Candidatus Calditenuaceae archaeon]MDW8073185.1 winged helix-turn-helix domain-containing protein [Nitrososphaerota archaeon]
MTELSAIFQALGNETRLKILIIAAQSERPLHIKAYARLLKKRYSAVYRHIALLRKAGLVTIYEVGRSRVVSIKKGLDLEAMFRSLASFGFITEQ